MLVYDGTNGVFTHIGKLIKHYNQFRTDATHATTGLDKDRNRGKRGHSTFTEKT
jgi:hypothetical protein